MDTSVKDRYLTTFQAANKLHIFSESEFRALLKKGSFSRAIKKANHWYIPSNDVYQIKESYSNSFNVRHVSEILNTSEKEVIDLIEQGEFPNSFEGIYKEWRIPLTDLAKYEMKDTMSVKQAIEMLDMEHEKNLKYLISVGKFPKVIKIRGIRRVLITDFVICLKRKRRTDGCLDTKEVAERLGYKAEYSINQLIKKEVFPNAFMFDSKWWIPQKDIIEIEKQRYLNLDTNQAAMKLGCERSYITQLIRHGKFPNAFKGFSEEWRIPLQDLEAFNKSPNSTSNMTVDEVASQLGYKSRSSVLKYLKLNKFPNAVKHRGVWHIPREDIESFQKPFKKPKGRKKGITNHAILHSTTNDELSDISSGKNNKSDSVKPNVLSKSALPKPKKSKAIQVSETLEEPSYTADDAYSFLKSSLAKNVESSPKLRETNKLYLSYCLLQINNMGGALSYRRGRVRLYISLYEKLSKLLNEEIYLASEDQITGILGMNSDLRVHEKKVLIAFLKYAYHTKNIKPSSEFSVINSSNGAEVNNEKEIYSPEQFHVLYEYVKDISLHTTKSLKDRHYANMWVYVILLLTDFIRGQDLIKNTPVIDLELVGISSLNWFDSKSISESQAEKIILQLYAHFRNKRTSKTGELLTFIVAPDLRRSLATALVISELHRILEGSKIQLETFMEGRFNRVRTSGKARHRHFFNNMINNQSFKLGSLKMNRSVATYLFYSITEQDGEDSDLALHLTQVARSHKKVDSTSTYIQATNRDGPINRVSYNLFKRGHFGWLYNYLVLFALPTEKIQGSIEERSELIEEIRQEITPSDLENHSMYVKNVLNPLPLDLKSKGIESFIEDIKNKRQTLISRLRKYSEEEIKEIILKLSKGDLPSKTENAQCFVAPRCERPNLKNCFSCEFVIPGDLVLIQLNAELDRLIKNIKKSTNNIILQRDSRFLLNSLFIWKEARLVYGDEKVSAYISPEEIWRKIEEISNKLFID